MFERRGIIELEKVDQDHDELDQDHDELELELIDVGADEIIWEGDSLRVLTGLDTFEQCLKVLNTTPVQKSDIALVAQEDKEIQDVQIAKKIVKLVELLEDDDDVDEVFTNADFPSGVLDQL